MKRDKRGRFIKGYHYSPETEFKKGHHWRSPKPFWNKDWLIEEYINKRKTAEEIAKENKCSTANILFWLRKHKIKRRKPWEKKYPTRLKGQDNPMWNKRGALNPNWKGGVTPERQAFYLSREWKNACLIVWKRDNATCQRCGVKRDETDTPFHIHHIKSFANKELRADPDNLILLCETCHRWVHSKANTKKEFIK